MDPKESKKTRQRTMIFLAGLLFLTGSVYGQNVEENESSHLKVIHLSPSAESVDISIDEKQVATNIGFGGLTSTELNPGAHEVTLVSDNLDISRTVSLEPDQHYILALNNRGLNPDTTLIAQNNRNSNDQTRLRLAHFSPDLLTINTDVENGDSFSPRSLEYLETGEYTELSAGNYTLTVSETRIGGTSFTSQIRLRENRSYTGFITGLESGNSEQSLRIIPVSQNIEPQTNEDETENNGQSQEDENIFSQDFSIVCRLEQTESN